MFHGVSPQWTWDSFERAQKSVEEQFSKDVNSASDIATSARHGVREETKKKEKKEVYTRKDRSAFLKKCEDAFTRGDGRTVSSNAPPDASTIAMALAGASAAVAAAAAIPRLPILPPVAPAAPIAAPPAPPSAQAAPTVPAIPMPTNVPQNAKHYNPFVPALGGGAGGGGGNGTVPVIGFVGPPPMSPVMSMAFAQNVNPNNQSHGAPMINMPPLVAHQSHSSIASPIQQHDFDLNSHVLSSPPFPRASHE
jgi:hypothetical protein